MTSISATPLSHFFLRAAEDKLPRSDSRLLLLEDAESRKVPEIKGFHAYFPSTLDIITTVSTCLGAAGQIKPLVFALQAQPNEGIGNSPGLVRAETAS